jgi:hypothetical protein
LNDHLYYQAAIANKALISEGTALEDNIKPGIMIDLPYQCQQALNDPYQDEGETGSFVGHYPHTNTGVNHRVCIVTCTVKSAEVPMEASKASAGDINWME